MWVVYSSESLRHAVVPPEVSSGLLNPRRRLVVATPRPA